MTRKLESFCPGAAERLGVGLDVELARNPSKLVYGRLTGWGQDGPLKYSAGHSLNYESLTGAIGSVGAPGGAPIPVLQVLGDFAGGGLHLAYGVVCALFETQRSGKGQVVDAAMIDGVASIFSVFYGMARSGMHTEDIGTNLFDGGSPFYSVYETSDGKYVTLAPIEPHFYAQLLAQLGIAGDLPAQYDKTRWPEMKERIGVAVRARRRAPSGRRNSVAPTRASPVYRFGEAHEQAPAQRGAEPLRARARWWSPGGAGAPLQPHGARGGRLLRDKYPGVGAHRRGARRVRVQRRRRGGPAGDRRYCLRLAPEVGA